MLTVSDNLLVTHVTLTLRENSKASSPDGNMLFHFIPFCQNPSKYRIAPPQEKAFGFNY